MTAVESDLLGMTRPKHPQGYGTDDPACRGDMYTYIRRRTYKLATPLVGVTYNTSR